jgi:hypothetical protein
MNELLTMKEKTMMKLTMLVQHQSQTMIMEMTKCQIQQGKTMFKFQKEKTFRSYVMMVQTMNAQKELELPMKLMVQTMNVQKEMGLPMKLLVQTMNVQKEMVLPMQMLNFNSMLVQTMLVHCSIHL